MTMFKAKARKVGTSLGIIIPSDVIKQQNIEEGSEIEIFLPSRNRKLLDKYFGMDKGSKPFKRDHGKDRV